MREKGWIKLGDTEDVRRKQIELTQAALLHFERLSHCMLQAAAGSVVPTSTSRGTEHGGNSETAD
jgi:hypothetical protein